MLQRPLPGGLLSVTAGGAKQGVCDSTEERPSRATLKAIRRSTSATERGLLRQVGVLAFRGSLAIVLYGYETKMVPT
jgi:hypothetical protein